MRLDLLTRVANAVERSKGTYFFDITGWGRSNCGCAIGIAIATGEFKEEGLMAQNPAYIGDDVAYRPVYNKQKDWPAVMDFLGLTEKDCLHLFHTSGYRDNDGKYYYPTADQVVARIRQFVADHTPKPIEVKEKVLELA